MARTARLRIVCMIMAVACVLAALLRLGGAVVTLVDPSWTTKTVMCERLQCRLLNDPLRLLGPVRAIEARQVPDAAAKLSARAQSPSARWMLFASKLVRALPDCALLLSLALALRSFAGGDLFGLRAVRWLRGAAAAAAASVLAQPIASSLRDTALLPAISDRTGVRLSVAGDEIVADLFLAGVVWVVAWALEEGRRNQAELAQYV